MPFWLYVKELKESDAICSARLNYHRQSSPTCPLQMPLFVIWAWKQLQVSSVNAPELTPLTDTIQLTGPILPHHNYNLNQVIKVRITNYCYLWVIEIQSNHIVISRQWKSVKLRDLPRLFFTTVAWKTRHRSKYQLIVYQSVMLDW